MIISYRDSSDTRLLQSNAELSIHLLSYCIDIPANITAVSKLKGSCFTGVGARLPSRTVRSLWLPSSSAVTEAMASIKEPSAAWRLVCCGSVALAQCVNILCVLKLITGKLNACTQLDNTNNAAQCRRYLSIIARCRGTDKFYQSCS
jgi:hypothetical protein